MAKFEPGAWVWIEDEEERYLPAKVMSGFTVGQATSVRTEDGEDHKLDAAASSKVVECNQEVLSSKIDDLINISDLNEMSILHSLRIRFKEDKIYTSISAILISVNPFRLLPLYTPEILANYRDNSRNLPPHIFQSAYTAYNDMLDNQLDQSVVISGESGAGKSEAMKLILQFLTVVSARAAGGGAEKAGAGEAGAKNLEQQLLASNPILEAFGNAKTSRNNNSSRFGKLITINFDNKGVIIGGGIINYLLEKSRVVTQTDVERNYHIFYQLISVASGADPSLASELDLKSPELFNITNPDGKGVVTIGGNHSDEKDFEDMQNSMRVLQFSADEKMSVFKIVAGVLHFGNLKFEEKGDDACIIANPAVADHAAKMWSCDKDMIKKFLVSKNLGNRSVVLVPYNLTQARDARDAMVKRVYGDLFQWLVDRINVQLAANSANRHKFIGVLDIFGFESFEVNSFEQLCINFCNEKLQFHFNEHIFKMEQTLYQAEGIVIPGSAFVDNQPTLDLLELKGTGLFAMTDEEISVPRGSDDTLLKKMHTKHEKHANYEKPKGRVCKDPMKCFGVVHYAGIVYYNITAFLDKNKDELHADLVGVLSSSEDKIMASFFVSNEPAAPGGRGGGAPKKKKTLGFQFKAQLNELITTLNSTHPNFVRCMKSNDKKVGRIFSSQRMQDQLRYAGLVEVCRIRKLGFPVRREFDEFFKRYKCCDLTSPGLDAMLSSLESKGVMIKGEWAKGKTRVFMRTAQNLQLEAHREQALDSVARVAQKWIRRHLAWSKFQYWLRIIRSLHAAIKSREEEALTESVNQTGELPHGGTTLPVAREARKLLAIVQEENRLLKLVSGAIESKNLSSLHSAIKAAASASNPPAKLANLISKAKALAADIEAEMAILDGLKAAVHDKSLPKLTDFISKAAAKGLTSATEYSTAVALKKSIEEEEGLIKALQAAVKSGDLDSMNDAIAACKDHSTAGSRPEVDSAIAAREKLVASKGSAEVERQAKLEAERAKEREAKQEGMGMKLKEAMNDGNAKVLAQLLQQCIEKGVTGTDVDEASDMLDKLRSLDGSRDDLEAAMKVLQMKAQSLAGITEAGDWEPLETACASAAAAAASTGLPFAELEEAKQWLERYKQHPEAKAQLQEAKDSDDRLTLKGAVDFAENMGVSGDLLADCAARLRELQIAFREEKLAAGESVEDADEDYDLAEEKREERKEQARQMKYEFKNFPNLRSADDFARGFLMNKAKMKEGFLIFNENQIPKSLSKLDSKLNTVAVLLNQNILGYCGDKQMPYPAVLAQDLLRKGVEEKGLRDEIYSQLIKHLSSNTRAESVAKAWQLMCMCVGVFPPSFDMEFYLMHYILLKAEAGKGAVVDYAKYCTRALEGTLASGDNIAGYVPNEDEIQAFKERPPILANVFLPDGNLVAENLPIPPDVNVSKILTLCIGLLDLNDPRVDMMGIFVYDTGPIDPKKDYDQTQVFKGLQRTPRPLRNDDFMGDVTVQKARQRRQFKFVIKKKIFLPKHMYRGEDYNYERLMYIQAEDEAISSDNLLIEEAETMAYLSALSIAVNFADEGLPTDMASLIEAEMMTFVSPTWREAHSEEEWATMILEHLESEDIAQADPNDLADTFINAVSASPLFGCHFFNMRELSCSGSDIVRNLDKEYTFAFSHLGMSIYTKEKQLVHTFPFSDIYRWGGSSSQFSLVLADRAKGPQASFELVVATCQAADMAAVILDMIKAIMDASKKK
jgi:myosin heavy subunit